MSENNEITRITKITLPVVGKFDAFAKFTALSSRVILPCFVVWHAMGAQNVTS